jgi:hypothetical protein
VIDEFSEEELSPLEVSVEESESEFDDEEDEDEEDEEEDDDDDDDEEEEEFLVIVERVGIVASRLLDKKPVDERDGSGICPRRNAEMTC